jgi:hypothetical protein
VKKHFKTQPNRRLHQTSASEHRNDIPLVPLRGIPLKRGNSPYISRNTQANPTSKKQAELAPESRGRAATFASTKKEKESLAWVIFFLLEVAPFREP